MVQSFTNFVILFKQDHL